MALQMFPPTVFPCLGSDGLYRIKHWVYIVWFVLPFAVAAVAFANPSSPAFVYQAAFCVLPFQPIAFRLGISWIPRYLIWLYVVATAIKIYLHVGKEFKIFRQEECRMSEVSGYGDLTSASGPSTQADASASARRSSLFSSNTFSEKDVDEEVSTAPDNAGQNRRTSTLSAYGKTQWSEPSVLGIYNHARRQSVPSPTAAYGGFSIEAIPGGLRSEPSSRRGSRQFRSDASGTACVDYATKPANLSSHRTPTHSVGDRSILNSSLPNSPALEPIAETGQSQPSSAHNRHCAEDTALQARRRAIQKSLRHLFIYPVVYIAVWMVPFVAQCLRYNPYYVRHPVFAVNTISVFSQVALGFVDVCVFCWREQPWKHINGSDGTFLGSFKFWQIRSPSPQFDRRRSSSAGAGQGAEQRTTSMGESSPGFISRLLCWSASHKNSSMQRNFGFWHTSSIPSSASHRRGPSSGSDRQHAQADLAYQRLALERQDRAEQNRRSRANERKASAASRFSRRKSSSQARGTIPSARKPNNDRVMAANCVCASSVSHTPVYCILP
ncbi:hypothetical protein K431DRAFT_284732 [Polychaeton citri CBS 116435]|uniref:G protein-coupled receptor GPR1 C-terminal domain-containing protein n=1 Tax=Polychaeton citri CBS 116435 TaxID=1314669 RepID=A0A9P4Q871_9PEZI|nr:hypothetical protein K431DRAFT_284732 [Polychaeton citri CBS 116435]